MRDLNNTERFASQPASTGDPAARPSEPSAPQGVGNEEEETEKESTQTVSEFSAVRPVSRELPVRLTAPQTSAEPQPLPCRTPGAVYHFKLAHSEQSGREILTLHVYMPQEISIVEKQAQSIEEKLHDACEVILSAYWPNTFAAAPQPVSASHRNFICPTDEIQCDWPKCVDPKSGDSYFDAECFKRMNAVSRDAPKVEEAQRALVRWLEKWELIDNPDANVALRLAMDEIFDEKENADLLAILRPYFPPASQTPYLPSVEEIIKLLGNGWKGFTLTDTDDLMFAVGQIRLAIAKHNNRATPASTARTDGWVSDISQKGETMNFGQAIEALKNGQKVSRSGWNGKNMWLGYVPADQWGLGSGQNYDYGKVGNSLLPWIGMKTADSAFVPWLASQTDVLAEDWGIVA